VLSDLMEQLGASWTHLAEVLVSGVVAYIAVILLTRISGVRSLAKMSSFDFAATVAVGSTLAATLLGQTPLVAGLAGLAVLFGAQWVIGTARRRDLLRGALDNAPLLLMAGGEVLDSNLRHARVSREELWSQLRLAGVCSRAEVYAVVMETTGDISVLRAGEPVDAELLDGVRGAEALA
jgi:uncharacterized membrane protein YcaP (DUF421 family)